MKKLTHEEFVRMVYEIYGDKYEVVSTYTRACDYVSLKCKECKTVFPRIANQVTSKKSVCCPVCDSKKITNVVIKGVTDLWTTRPDVAELLADKEIGHLYRENSDYETEFICPHCHLSSNKNIKNVTSGGFSCPFCSDNISYPNKFMAHFLRETNIRFRAEYTISPYLYRYDFYFELNNKKYVVELDGAYGHGEIDTQSKTIEQQIFEDNEKDRIAQEHDHIMIRLDCKYKNIDNRFDYIKQSFNSSLLNTLFNYDDNLLKSIDKKCLKSILVEVAEKWNDGMHSYDEFEKTFGISRPVARRYLKRACEINLINLNYEDLLKEVRLASNKKLATTKGKRVRCNETGEEFYSLSEAERQTGFNLRNYFSKKYKYCGKLPDGTKLTWSYVT